MNISYIKFKFNLNLSRISIFKLNLFINSIITFQTNFIIIGSIRYSKTTYLFSIPNPNLCVYLVVHHVISIEEAAKNYIHIKLFFPILPPIKKNKYFINNWGLIFINLD